MRKRHKGSEEEHGALSGTGKARGRSQPWDEHGTSADFLSQVSVACALCGPLLGLFTVPVGHTGSTGQSWGARILPVPFCLSTMTLCQAEFASL